MMAGETSGYKNMSNTFNGWKVWDPRGESKDPLKILDLGGSHRGEQESGVVQG